MNDTFLITTKLFRLVCNYWLVLNLAKQLNLIELMIFYSIKTVQEVIGLLVFNIGYIRLLLKKAHMERPLLTPQSFLHHNSMFLSLSLVALIKAISHQI